MIHGEKDAYIGPEIARRLFAEAGEPKELWIVPGAKHNRCREVDPDAYAARVVEFLRRLRAARGRRPKSRADAAERIPRSSSSRPTPARLRPPLAGIRASRHPLPAERSGDPASTRSR